MGAVYKAEHRLMGRVVALKALHRQLTERPAVVERFRREVQAAAGLSHPNVVAALDADQAGDRHFLVMEYVEGITLARLVHEHGPLPPESACEYARQAALGLQHAHEKGLVHRDVKPANLMLTPEGRVKILDFGLARLAPDTDGGMTAPDTLIGTVDFLAPEQADDPRAADTRADVYSLGCTLYFLLTGHPPFAEGTLVQKLKAHTLREPPPLGAARPDLPPGLEAVIRKMLAKEPARRFRTPEEVAEALAPFADPARAKDGEPRRLARRKLTVRLFLAALIAGTAALSFAVYRVVTDHGELEITTNEPGIEVVLERNGETVRVIDLEAQQTLTLRSGEYVVKADRKVAPVEVDPSRVVVSRGNKVTVTVRHGLVLIDRFESPAPVRCLAVSADEKLALGGTGDGTIILWTLSRGGGLARVEGHPDPVVPPLPPGVIDATKPARFEGHRNVVTDLTFTRDARRFLSSSLDGTVRLWDVATRTQIRQYKGHDHVGGIDGGVEMARISPDGRSVLTGCQDKKFRLFDLETGEEKKVLTGHGAAVTCVAFAPDSRRALSGDWVRTVRLWDLDKGLQTRSWVLDDVPHRVVWLGDGQRFLTCGIGGKLLLWDLDKDTPVRSYDGHDSGVYDVILTADERFVVSAGQDATVRYWDLNSGQELLRYRTELGGIYGLGLCQNGHVLLTTGRYVKGVHAYQVPQGLWPANK
jgi:WD40 repeat protein